MSAFPHLFDAFSAQTLHFMTRCCQCSVVQQHGVQLVTDAVSYELLKGATLDYTTDLIRASFEVRILGPGIASNRLNKHSQLSFTDCIFLALLQMA